jgi:hypothetical protein
MELQNRSSEKTRFNLAHKYEGDGLKPFEDPKLR